jgi:indole-3-glycerol phosphate synthase
MALREFVSEEIVFVSESGIKTREDIVRLEEAKVDAVLIGETMMRSRDKAAKLRELKGIK